MTEDRLIPTLAMEREPRLRRLFALAGRVLNDGVEDRDVENALTEVLIELAPEYVPPDEPEHVPEWEQLCAEACRNTTHNMHGIATGDPS